MAFEAARELKASPQIIGNLEKVMIEQGINWYLLHGLVDRPAFHRSAAKAYSEALPDMLAWFEHEGVGKYCTAPVISDEEWLGFLRSRPAFRSENRAINYQLKL
jgi:hypothetical protein